MIRASSPLTYLTLSIHFPKLLKELASKYLIDAYWSNRKLLSQRYNLLYKKVLKNEIFIDLQYPKVAFLKFYYQH